MAYAVMDPVACEEGSDKVNVTRIVKRIIHFDGVAFYRGLRTDRPPLGESRQARKCEITPDKSSQVLVLYQERSGDEFLGACER